MKKKTPLVILLLMMVYNASGQNLPFQVPDFFYMRIKSIDDFMQRFNRDKLPPILDSMMLDPYEQLVTCFCLDSVSSRVNDVVEFAHYMVDNNVHLAYQDTNYHCELNCGALYMGQETSVILRMVVEKSDKGYYSWVISDAEGDVLKQIPVRSSPSMKLSPIDNLQDFSELQHMFDVAPFDVSNYICRRWTIDELSAFVALLSNGLLKITEIRDIQYIFHVGDYNFKVKFFGRETNNSGWLIYDFFKFNA